MSIGDVNDKFTLVETPTGHDVYSDPSFASTAVDIPVWFEEHRGDRRQASGGVKEWDAIAIGEFDIKIEENSVLTLDSDGTKWKVQEWNKYQGLNTCSVPEKRIELKLLRQRE